MHSIRTTILAFVALGLAVAASAQIADVRGSQDHPLISRFPGSRIIGYMQKDWEQTSFPLSSEINTDNSEFRKPVTVEGKVTRVVYLAPAGKSRLEVYRNYEQALLGAGLVKKFACDRNCGQLFFAWRFNAFRNSLAWSDRYVESKDNPGTQWNTADAVSAEEGRCLYGTLKRGGRETHVLMYTSIAAASATDAAATVIEIAEPREMLSGQVTVDAKSLLSGLEAEGRVAIYGVYFDTGRAEIKPESQPQLEQMAELMRSLPVLKVLVVGHTDNQGEFDSNVTLSRQRAQAVVDALAKNFGIAATRMKPYGVASAAPVASNTDETGRARNRRVELVKQ
jgi:OOP family OmpA-OmpF porin